MSYGIETFHNMNWSIRSVAIDGQAWLVLADLCKCLDLPNTSMVAGRIDDDALSTAEVIDSMGRKQTATVVNEAGMYEVVFLSRKPEARDFKRWLTNDVLPTIRRTGSYNPAPIPTARELAALVIAEADRADAAEARAVEAETQVAELAPAAQSWEVLASANGDLSVREAAHVLQRDHGIDIGATRLFVKLKQLGWSDKFNRPLQAHGPNGTGRVSELLTEWTDHDTGRTHIKTQLRVTAKGVADLHRILTSSALSVVS